MISTILFVLVEGRNKHSLELGASKIAVYLKNFDLKMFKKDMIIAKRYVKQLIYSNIVRLKYYSLPVTLFFRSTALLYSSKNSD